MDLIKTWVLRIVIASIAGVAVLVLNPKGAAEKSVRTAVSLFILCSFVSPFLSEIEIPQLESSTVVTTVFSEENSEEIILEQMRLELSSRINDILLSEDVSPESINVDVSMNDDGEIVVKKIIVVIDADDYAYAEKLKNAVYSESGMNIEIEVKNAKQAD